jgi:endonuclease/exonuclease/phosphatase family metal-dependent hydrolase
MHSSSFFAGAAAGLAFTATAAGASFPVRAMTYNIRYAATGEKLEVGEEPWPARQPVMASMLNYETAGRPEALLCMQEVLYPQLLDIKDGLNSRRADEWAYVGIGRDDGVEEGEFSPIFYRPGAWELVTNRTYWLSETPDVVGSIGWDASLARIVNVASLRHVVTGTPFVFMCTHFDHLGQVAREESAKLIVRLADQWAAEAGPQTPVFLGGDLNVRPDNAAYQYLAQELNDVQDVVPEQYHYGNLNTFTGFDGDESRLHRIDFLFARDASSVDFTSYAILENKFEGSVYTSDHRPVAVDFEVPVSRANDTGRTAPQAWLHP